MNWIVEEAIKRIRLLKAKTDNTDVLSSFEIYHSIGDCDDLLKSLAKTKGELEDDLHRTHEMMVDIMDIQKKLVSENARRNKKAQNIDRSNAGTTNSS